MSKFMTTFALAMLVMASAVTSVVWPSPYLLMGPGPALRVGTMISVPEEYRSEQGSIFLTSVSIQSTTIAQWALAHLDPSVRIIPREDTEQVDISTEDYQRLQVQLLDESKAVAKIVALRKLGYDVKMAGQGAQVEFVLPTSPARDRLEPGDTIVGVGGRELDTATELIDALRQTTPGDDVTLAVVRDGQRVEIKSGTIESASVPGQAMLGVVISTRMFDYQLPFDVQIDTDNLAGPSAGLMFTLGVMDSLTPGEITRGHKIAGTGTIAIDGSVGMIDGVKQKVIGAERAGVEYFLSPTENYEDAKAAARKAKVVPVRNIDDALAFLTTIEPAAKSEPPAGAWPSPSFALAW